MFRFGVIFMLAAAVFFAAAQLQADSACMAEEKPICQSYIDAQDKQRTALNAACVKLPGRPVNKCPERALFTCVVPEYSGRPGFIEYTYRANAATGARTACVGYGGKFAVSP
ncbi:MAG: hypothetical protein KF713_04895 [Turneriella sp.]|nr:hypothetical protein [Turneriella sp.]